MPQQALEGVLVLEHAQLVAGPYCAKLLASMGAEVIKLEPPKGDASRRVAPFVHDKVDQEHSCIYLYLNTNKKSVTLNLDTITGQGIFSQLTKEADVLIEDTEPGTMEALGLGYPALKERNPRLVVTSLTAFGQTGPSSHYKTYPMNRYHAGGNPSLIKGSEEHLDRPPVKGAGFLGDYEAGLNAAVATVATLYAQKQTGAGEHIDVSAQESMLALNRMMAVAGATAVLGSGGNRPADRRTRLLAYGGLFLCKDGYVQIQASFEKHWEILLRLMGDPEWGRDPRFATYAKRSKHRDEVNAYLREWAMAHTRRELYEMSLKVGCPLGAYFSPAEVSASPQLEARSFFTEIDHPIAGKGKYATMPFRLSDVPGTEDRPAPTLGQHNKQVYCDLLGHSKDDLITLKEIGAI